MNPKADFRKPDILVQVSDSPMIEIKGDWKSVPLRGYGKFHLENSTVTNNEYVQFNFDTTAHPGKYKAYYYLPRLSSDAKSVNLELFNGERRQELTLNLADVKIEGQTSSTWVYIGDFNFNFPAKPYIKVISTHMDGSVAANAILLVPED